MEPVSLRLRRHWGLVLVLLGALVVRVAIACKINASFGDEGEYTLAANRLLDGRPFAFVNTMFFVRAPGYSGFIAGVWSVFHGRSLLAVRLAQACISTVACFVTYMLTMRIRRDRRVALWATAAAGVYPYFVYHVAQIGSESLFTFLVVLGTYLFARALEDDGVRWAPFVGGVLTYAVAILVRPNLGPVEALIGVLLAWRYRRKLLTVLAIASTMVLGTLLVTVPWTLSVERQGLGRFFVSDGGAISYHVGHDDLAARLNCGFTVGAEHAALVNRNGAADPVVFVARTLPRTQQARFFWDAARHWDADHPSQQLCLAAGKLWYFWRPWVDPSAYSSRMVAVSLASSLPLLLLGIAGLWALRKAARGQALVVTANVAGGSLLAMIFSSEIRYRIPVVDALLVPYATCFAADLVRRSVSRLGPRKMVVRATSE